jgi:ADP-heptose:LPS heptosyltransferase
MKFDNRFNFDYFGVFKEAGIIERSAARIKRGDSMNDRVLIIIPCLIGDFVAALPAIADYVQRNSNKRFEMVVTPPLKELADNIRGVERVYAVRSVSKRINEGEPMEKISGEYEEVIILRASEDVLTQIVPYISANKIITKTKEVAKYSVFDLFKNNILRKRPTQWRDLNFTLLGGTSKHISFKEIFEFNLDDYARVRELGLLSSSATNIIIHTGASWHMMYWPTEKWISLLRKIHSSGNFNFIFIGAEKDLPDYRKISSHVDFLIVSAVGKVTIRDLTLLIAQADYFIGIDSGPGNIAHLVELKSLILYGPGPHTFMSHLPEDVMIDKSNGRGFYQRFFIKKKGFIHSISVEEVFEAFNHFITK